MILRLAVMTLCGGPSKTHVGLLRLLESTVCSSQAEEGSLPVHQVRVLCQYMKVVAAETMWNYGVMKHQMHTCEQRQN